jgi:hypothetical protein
MIAVGTEAVHIVHFDRLNLLQADMVLATGIRQSGP